MKLQLLKYYHNISEINTYDCSVESDDDDEEEEEGLEDWSKEDEPLQKPKVSTSTFIVSYIQFLV